MRASGASVGWVGSALVVVGSIVFVAWAVLTTGDSVHPIDVGLAAGTWVCLSMSVLGLTLAGYRILTIPTRGESAVLAVAIAIAICEIPVFAYMTVAVAFGIPAAP